MRRMSWSAGAVLVLLFALVGSVGAKDLHVSATVAPTATLVGTGQAVDLTVGVACGPGRAQVLEAFVYVTQDGNQSQFAPIRGIRCTNKTRWYTVRVQALDFQFHRGTANVSGYVLVTDPKTGGTASTSPTGTITIR